MYRIYFIIFVVVEQLDNTSALFEEVGFEIPKNDSYDNNTCISLYYNIFIVVGRVENLFMNNVNAQIETIEEVVDVVKNVARMIDNFTNILSDFSSIDFQNWEIAINRTEDWVLNIINQYI